MNLVNGINQEVQFRAADVDEEPYEEWDKEDGMEAVKSFMTIILDHS